MITARPMYGIGYAPIGDLADALDPFGLRKVPGAIKQRVDSAIEARTQHAANVAGAKVEAGVRRAMSDAEQKAITFAIGAAAGAVVVGGLVWFALRSRREEARS
jgi:hypothetical protein